MRNLLGDEVAVRVCRKPFPHIIADGLFGDDTYKSLCAAFDERLARGLSPIHDLKRFWKFGHYDAYCWSLLPRRDKEFVKIFYGQPWRDWVNGFFGLELTNCVMGELHHHLKGSGSGYVHNDYDLATFTDRPMPNGTNPFRHDVPYRGKNETENAVHCVLSVACLYYFNNPPLGSGHYLDKPPMGGGETALYEGSAGGPAKLVEPFNNRLLAFEISPRSWHAFVSNVNFPRNALAMWLHGEEGYCNKRYGEAPK